MAKLEKIIQITGDSRQILVLTKSGKIYKKERILEVFDDRWSDWEQLQPLPPKK